MRISVVSVVLTPRPVYTCDCEDVEHNHNDRGTTHSYPRCTLVSASNDFSMSLCMIFTTVEVEVGGEVVGVGGKDH